MLEKMPELHCKDCLVGKGQEQKLQAHFDGGDSIKTLGRNFCPGVALYLVSGPAIMHDLRGTGTDELRKELDEALDDLHTKAAACTKALAAGPQHEGVSFVEHTVAIDLAALPGLDGF